MTTNRSKKPEGEPVGIALLGFGTVGAEVFRLVQENADAFAHRIGGPVEIRGVAVLCDGGGDVRVAARITEMVGALLDLPSNRICVEQRKP